MAKGFSEVLSGESKNDVKGVGCLKKTVDSFAGEADSETKALIIEDIDSTVAQQISLNQATSAFAIQILSVLNSRRRFLLTDTKLMDESASQKDSEGFINGFVYTQEEKSTIVKAFENYANLLYSFNSNLNTRVSNVQGMIGSLEKCKPDNSTRLLQTTSGSQLPNNATLTQASGSESRPSGPKPSGSESRPSGPKPSGSESRPSGRKPSGGKPKGKDGRPEGKIPEELKKMKTDLLTSLKSKGGNWNLLGETIDKNLNPESEYKPNGSIQKNILMRIQGDQKTVIGNELHKIKSNQVSTADYLFYCTSGTCYCDGTCSEDLNKIKSINLSTNSQLINNLVTRLLQTNSTKPPGSEKSPIKKDDNPSEYYFALFALGGKRYSYFQALMSLSGPVIDFDAPGKSLGKSHSKEERKCKDALNSNITDKKLNEECRGNLNEKCSKGMDGACKNAGLYQRLVNRPLSEAALPDVCENTYPTYSLDNCFAWLEPIIIKNTLSFSFKGFKELPMFIDKSFKNSNSLRALQNTGQIIIDPVSKNDPNAVLPSTISKMESNSIDIEGATAVSAPSVETFIKTFNEESTKIELSDNNISFTFYTILIFIGLLF
jgi:hypothetical protein